MNPVLNLGAIPGFEMLSMDHDYYVDEETGDAYRITQDESGKIRQVNVGTREDANNLIKREIEEKWTLREKQEEERVRKIGEKEAQEQREYREMRARERERE